MTATATKAKPRRKVNTDGKTAADLRYEARLAHLDDKNARCRDLNKAAALMERAERAAVRS